MKITTKTTKEQLMTFLALNTLAVKEADKDLFDRIMYANKMCKTDESKVQKADLVSLVKDVMKVLGDKCTEPKSSKEEKTEAETPVETVETSTETTEAPVEPKAENSVKKLSKKSKTSSKTSQKATETKAEEPKSEPVAEETQKEEPKTESVDTKKSAKKSLGGKKKKETTPKEGVTVLEDTEKTVQLAKMFPKTITFEGAEYDVAHDIKNMNDLFNALGDENGKEILFAFYWTKRHLRQFPYFGEILGQPDSFENNLDICTALYVSDEKKIAYLISRYTEAFYSILPHALEEFDGLRVSDGIEYQIYRAK